MLAFLMLATCSNHPGPLTIVYLTPEPTGVVSLRFHGSTHTISAAFAGVGLAPNATYQLQLRRGTCLRPSDQMLVAFSSMAADPKGTVKTSVDSTDHASAIPKGIYIDLRLLATKGDTPASTSGGCADVSARSQTVAVRLYPPPALKAGGRVSARFTSKTMMSLRFEVIALEPGSVHAVHIGRGSCASGGLSTFNLGDLTAHSNGNATEQKVVRLHKGSGDWFVVIDEGPSRVANGALPDPTNQQSMLCGDLPHQ